MSASLPRLETTNKRICQFYSANPSINFDVVNLLFVDLFERLLTDMDKTMTQSIHSQLLTTLSANTQQITQLQSSVATLNTNVAGLNTELTATMLSRFSDLKQEYIRETKAIMDSTTLENITPLIERNNTSLIDKTTLLLSEMMPAQHKQIAELLQLFQKTIADDTTNLIKSVDIKDFLTQFEMKSAVLLQNVQQPIFSFISASEDRINNQLGSIKESSQTNQLIQTKVMDELNGFISKFRDTHQAQQFHDKQLMQVLTRVYNSAEISISHQTGLIMLKRQRKSNILIDNRDAEENISVDELTRFMSQIDEQHCNGIFVSQQSGISSKKNYQIEIHNNNIIVFVHHGGYSSSKIEVAVDIIDNIATRLKQFNPNQTDDSSIPKEVLDSINNEYQIFMTQKAGVVEVFKEGQKKVLSQIDEFRFPCLDKFLSTKYTAPIQKPGLKCDLCKSFCGNNLKALAAHKRGCIRKNVAANNLATENSINMNRGLAVRPMTSVL